jgi:hypothetical protein
MKSLSDNLFSREVSLDKGLTVILDDCSDKAINQLNKLTINDNAYLSSSRRRIF